MILSLVSDVFVSQSTLDESIAGYGGNVVAAFSSEYLIFENPTDVNEIWHFRAYTKICLTNYFWSLSVLEYEAQM